MSGTYKLILTMTEVESIEKAIRGHVSQLASRQRIKINNQNVDNRMEIIELLRILGILNCQKKWGGDFPDTSLPKVRNLNS